MVNLVRNAAELFLIDLRSSLLDLSGGQPEMFWGIDTNLHIIHSDKQASVSSSPSLESMTSHETPEFCLVLVQ